MSGGPLAAVPVEDDEHLARFVFDKRHVPKNGDGLRAQALGPYPHAELSVSRHREVTAEELWELGHDVARTRSEKEGRNFLLLGRADFLARTVRAQKLGVKPDEPPRNHANVIGWPAEKHAQMSLAQEIAAQSVFVKRR